MDATVVRQRLCYQVDTSSVIMTLKPQRKTGDARDLRRTGLRHYRGLMSDMNTLKVAYDLQDPITPGYFVVTYIKIEK